MKNNIHAYTNKLKIVTEKQRNVAREHIIKVNKSRVKKVFQYDKKLNLLNIFESVKEASYKLNISTSCISEVCNKKQKTAGGFIFSFGGDIKYDR